MITTVFALDLTPFIAKAFAEKKEIRVYLDEILAEGWLNGDYKLEDNMKYFANYYAQSSPLIELYSQKATILLFSLDETGEKNVKATRALEYIIRTYWPKIYYFILQTSGEIRIDEFWQKEILNNMKPTSSIGEKNFKELVIKSGYRINTAPQLLQGNRKMRRRCNTVKKPRVQVMEQNALDGQFPIFLFTAQMMKRQVQEHTSFYDMLFNIYMYNQEKLKRNPFFLNNEQKKKAEYIWTAIENRLFGIPQTLAELFSTMEGNRLKPLFLQENISSLPFERINNIKIATFDLRKIVEVRLISVPNKVELTDELLRELLILWGHAMFVHALSAEYQQIRKNLLQELKDKKQNNKDIDIYLLNRKLDEATLKIIYLDNKEKQQTLELNEHKEKTLNLERVKEEEKNELKDRLRVLEIANERMMNSLDEEVEDDEAISAEQLADIHALRVVVLGGREDFRQRMKAKFPAFRFIASSEERYDLSLLDNADLIVICWKYIGHAMFKRTIYYIGENNEKVAYLANTNESFLVWLLLKRLI